MDIDSVHHDQETNTVTIKVCRKQNPIVCQALNVTYSEGHPVFLVLDRLIHKADSDKNSSVWDTSGAFVTEIARSDHKHLFSVIRAADIH